MFSHIVLGADDISAAKTFYDATLGALGYAPGIEFTPGVNVVYKADTGMLIITKPRDGQPATIEEAHPANAIEDFISAVREGRPPLVDGQEGKRSVDLLAAIYKSARKGAPVKMD